MSLTCFSSFSSRSTRLSSSLSSLLQSFSCSSWPCRSACACLVSANCSLKLACEWPTYCSYSLQAIILIARNSLCRQVLAIDFSCAWSSCSASIEMFSSSLFITPSLLCSFTCQIVPIYYSISFIRLSLFLTLSWLSGLAWIWTSLWASLTTCVNDSLKSRLICERAAGECCFRLSCCSALLNWLLFILILCRSTCRCCCCECCCLEMRSSILSSSAMYCPSCSATSLESIFK